LDPQRLVERLSGIGTTIMSDVLDEAGLTNCVLSPIFRPLDPKARMAGIAFCAKREPVVRAGNPQDTADKFELENRMQPGLIVVIDAGGDAGTGGMVGGFAASTLQAKGCRGLLVHGAVRDGLEILELGLPAFTVGVSPVAGTRRREILHVDVPVALPGSEHGGVTVFPGDYILGDYDGVVVLPQRWAAQLIEAAETVVAIEAEIQKEVSAGVTREKALKAHPRFAHIKPLR
jgi:4-hydroxy-4-methyl-2-oxoglutarate aldolase